MTLGRWTMDESREREERIIREGGGKKLDEGREENWMKGERTWA